jgi:hypothetical protein
MLLSGYMSLANFGVDTSQQYSKWHAPTTYALEADQILPASPRYSVRTRLTLQANTANSGHRKLRTRFVRP